MLDGSSCSPTPCPFLSRTGSLIAITIPLLLHCRTDRHQATLGTGDAALDGQQVVLRVDDDHLKVLGGHALAAHPAGHTRPLQHAARGAGCADGTGRALAVRLAVSLLLTIKAMPLHGTGKALALADPHHVDTVALFEDLDRDLLARLNTFDIVDPELAQVTQRRDRCLKHLAGGMLLVRLQQPQVTALRLGQATLDLALARGLVVDAGCDFLIAKLHCPVAVTLVSLDLRDPARASLDHCHRDH